MARLPRFDIFGNSLHIVQLGDSRLPCLLDDHDRRRYLSLFSDALAATDCRRHAYVLMDNHVRLLATPRGAAGVSERMQLVDRRYVAEFKRRHGCIGTRREGRFKSSPVESDGRVLACHRDIEMNPGRAGIVPGTEAFPWSSRAGNPLGRRNPLSIAHASCLTLAMEPRSHAEVYRVIARERRGHEDIDCIRSHLQQQRLCSGGFGAGSRRRPNVLPVRARRVVRADPT